MSDSLLLQFLLSLLDIVLVAFFLYQFLLRFRGSPARPAFFGLLLLSASYLVSQVAGLVTLQWIMNHFVQNIFLILVILFQNEIRRALVQMGEGRPFFSSPPYAHISSLEEITKAAERLREARLGALIVIERNTPLGEIHETGVRLDARVSEELLVSLFQPTSPLHDGAVIVDRDRVVSAGCFLPLDPTGKLAKELGTRHQAALSISRETDAVTVVISEEKGTISLAYEGRLLFSLDTKELRARLLALFQRGGKA